MKCRKWGRSMLVKRLKPVPIEAVVRGYLAGSGWKEYQESGAVCGVKAARRPEECIKLPEPIYTPPPRLPWETTTKTSRSRKRPR